MNEGENSSFRTDGYSTRIIGYTAAVHIYLARLIEFAKGVARSATEYRKPRTGSVSTESQDFVFHSSSLMDIYNSAMDNARNGFGRNALEILSEAEEHLTGIRTLMSRELIIKNMLVSLYDNIDDKRRLMFRSLDAVVGNMSRDTSVVMQAINADFVDDLTPAGLAQTDTLDGAGERSSDLIAPKELLTPGEVEIDNDDVEGELQELEGGGRNGNIEFRSIKVTLKEIHLPGQIIAPLQTYERGGKIARLPKSSQKLHVSELRDAARSGLIAAIDDFETSFNTHNHPAFGRALCRLREALGKSPSDVDAISLGMAGVRIAQYAGRADEIFAGDIAAEVSALHRNIETNLSHFEEWVFYSSGLISDPQPAQEEIVAAQQVAAVLVEHNVLELEVREEIEAELLPLTTGVEGEGGTLVERRSFMRSVRNIVVSASESLKRLLLEVGGKFKDGAFEGIQESGKYAVIAALGGAVTWLVVLARTNQLFSFLSPILPFLKEIAKFGN